MFLGWTTWNQFFGSFNFSWQENNQFVETYNYEQVGSISGQYQVKLESWSATIDVYWSI